MGHKKNSLFRLRAFPFILLFFLSRAWQHLCGAKYRMSRQPGSFEHYVHETGEQKWIDDIQKDLHRNFPNHEMFGGTYERIGRVTIYSIGKT